MPDFPSVNYGSRSHALSCLPARKKENAEKELNRRFVSRKTDSKVSVPKERKASLPPRKKQQETQPNPSHHASRRQKPVAFPGLGRFDLARGHSRCFLPCTVSSRPTPSCHGVRPTRLSPRDSPRRRLPLSQGRAGYKARHAPLSRETHHLLHLPLLPASSATRCFQFQKLATRLLPAFESDSPEPGGRRNRGGNKYE